MSRMSSLPPGLGRSHLPGSPQFCPNSRPMRDTPSFVAKGTTIMVTPPQLEPLCHRFFSFWLILVMCLGCAFRAYSQCSTPANPIVAENCLRGNPASEWDVGQNSAGDSTIQGLATDISVNQGGTIGFKINTNAKAYTITIYRIGYYRGMGARKIAAITPSVPLPQI